MDSAFQSERNCRNPGLEGFEAEGCNITSLVFRLRGKYEFELTIHGRFVCPSSHKIDRIPPLELPEPALGKFPTIRLDEDSNFGGPDGPRATFSSGLGRTALEDEGPMGAPVQASGPVLSGFDERNPDDMFIGNETEQNMDFIKNFDANSDFQTFNSHANFPLNNFNCPYYVEASPSIPSANSQIGFSSNEFNSSNSAPRSSQESSFSSASSSSSSNLSVVISPSTSATTPNIIDSTPDGHFCGLCTSVFTRLNDLQRHEGIHYPEKRIYHFQQSGCERKGLNGFYRRDKLRAHERQVHGLDN